MMENKKEEKKIIKRGIVITKEIAIAFVVGILFGTLLTYFICCSCRKNHFPSAPENKMTEVRENNRQDTPKKFDRQNKHQRKAQKTEVNQTIEDNSTSNN